MKRLTLLFRRLVSHPKTVSWPREVSATKAWALGLGIVGGVALFSISASPLGNFLAGNDADESAPLAGLPESDETLVHAVYAAGMVQDLGTFGGYPAAKPDRSSAKDFTASATSSGDAGEIVALFPARGRSDLGASLDLSGQLWGESSLALAATNQSFRASSVGGGRGGVGGGRSPASGGGNAGQNAPLTGAGAAGGSPRLQTNGEPSLAVSGDDKGSGFSSPPIAGNEAAALLADDVFLAGGAGAGIPELLLAETIANPGSTPAGIDADAAVEAVSRVPEVAATWALFAAALASFTVLRRIFG